jgi:LysR family transcriptional regulator, hydrogen peroxide-inducible genes activator
MQKLRKTLPDLGLMLYEYQTEPLLKRLRDGEIDAGIFALPDHRGAEAHGPEMHGLETRALYEEAFTVALPNHHPLTAKTSIKVQDLKGQTLLLLEDGHCLRDQALEVCSRVDVKEAEDFRATSLETLRQMVVAGLGITLLPELAVESPFGSQRGAAAVAAVCDVVDGIMGKRS